MNVLFYWLMAIIIVLSMILVITQLLTFVLLFHCLVFEKDMKTKILWLVILLLTGLIGAFLYLVIRVPKNMKERKGRDIHGPLGEDALKFFSGRQRSKIDAMRERRDIKGIDIVKMGAVLLLIFLVVCILIIMVLGSMIAFL